MSIEVIQVGTDATAVPVQIGDVTVVEITIPDAGADAPIVAVVDLTPM